MFLALAILLAIAAFLLVSYPIISKVRSGAPATSSAEETLNELLAQRDSAFQALRELNFDHEVGKITDEDFLVFEANLKQTAANTLRALDGWEAEADLDLNLALEAEIAARRAVLQGGRVCAVCGRAATADDKFCAGCGAPLPAAPIEPEPAALTCPNCARPFEAGDRFCAGCGQPLSEGQRLTVA